MHRRRQEIVEYYDGCEADYRLVWRLGRAFALHYGYWDPSVEGLTEALLRMNQVLAERAAIGRFDRVLDAGCGVGGSALYLARRFGCRVVGLTLSDRQAASARRNAERFGVADRTAFVVGDYMSAPFPSGAFDVVWALESACYAPSKGAFVREAARLLRPGGRLVLADGFASRERFEGQDRDVMESWLRNWAVESLETPSRYLEHLWAHGFDEARFDDITARVLPSSQLLDRRARYALPFARLAERLGLRTAIQTRNVVACRFQYIAFRDGLSCYGLLSGRKSEIAIGVAAR